MKCESIVFSLKLPIWIFGTLQKGHPTLFMKLLFIPLELYTNDIGIIGKLDNQPSIII